MIQTFERSEDPKIFFSRDQVLKGLDRWENSFNLEVRGIHYKWCLLLFAVKLFNHEGIIRDEASEGKSFFNHSENSRILVFGFTFSFVFFFFHTQCLQWITFGAPFGWYTSESKSIRSCHVIAKKKHLVPGCRTLFRCYISNDSSYMYRVQT